MNRTRTSWKVREHVLTIGERTLIMGVLNVTPDSFSDGGKYLDTDAAVARALELEQQGADILDIGAESTRPGSERINAGEELRRLVPVLKKLKGHLSIPIAVDTYKAEVAEKALEHGASIINDVSALTWEPDLAKPVIKYDAGLVLNHMRGTPETWVRMAPMKDVMGTLLAELEAAVHRAVRAGVPRERLVIDPGIGFGKRGDQNYEILARLGELQKFVVPILVAASRKSFLGQAEDPRALEFATAAAVATSILHGAAIVRVHDVAAMRAVVQSIDAVLEATPEKEEKSARPEKKPRFEETIEEKRRRPVRPTIKPPTRTVVNEPVPVQAEAAEVDDASQADETPAERPAAEIAEPPALPRRPFERRAEAPPASDDRPARGSEDKKAPTKKFFQFRDDDRKEKKGPPARRARPEGPRDDRARDDRGRDDRGRDDRGRDDRASARPPFRRSGPPSGDRPERGASQRSGPPFRRSAPPTGDRPDRSPSQRSGPPVRRSAPPSGDRPDRGPSQRSGPPARGGRGDRDQKPYERRTGGAPYKKDDRGGGGDRPTRRPFQRADDDRRPSGPPRGGERSSGPSQRGPSRTGGNERSGSDRPERRPPGGRPAFPPRDGERRGGRPPGPRTDDRDDRPRGGSGAGGSGNRRPPFGSGGGGGPKRGGGGPPPRGPRKRT